MGSILAMLILGAYMQAPHFAGNLGILFSLGMRQRGMTAIRINPSKPTGFPWRAQERC